MRLRLGPEEDRGVLRPEAGETAPELLRRNVQALLDWRRWNQAQLADRIGRSQPWVSKRLNGKTRVSLEDLELIAGAFMLPAHALLHSGGFGQFERRSGRDRRTLDRRRHTRMDEDDPAA